VYVVFRRTLKRALLAGLVSAAVAVVSLPVAAEAQRNSPAAAPSAATVSAAAAADTGLADAFGGPVRALVSGLCPVATTLSNGTYTVPGVGTLVDQLSGVICAINVAGYVYRTTYLPPSGPPVVRYTKALAGVPALIDVDGVGLPDFTGTIGVNLLAPGITLTVARSLLFPASARVSIEAIAIAPTSPDTYIGFGEDGTAAGTARNWKALLSVAGLSSTTADLGLSISTTAPPSSLATTGELFTGPNPDAPEKTYRGTVAFTPVPGSFNTRIRAAEARQQVIVTSPPTKLTARVSVLTPGREQNVDLTADQLPKTVDIVHTTAGASDTTTYDATGPVARLTARYRDKVDGGIATAAALDAFGVPEHIRFEQTDATTTVAATSGKIDRVQARFAQGSDVVPLDAGTEPFARFHRTSPSAFKAALQVSDLKSVSINQSAPYGGELVFATAPGLFPFVAQDDVSSTRLEGSLSNLPLDTTVSVDLDNGAVTFDGHGTGIDEIALKATRPTPFFARATRLEATLADLPALETVNIAQADGAVTATASAPLGTLTLLASDGSDAPAIAGPAASYEDTATLYRAFLRIDGLKSVSFQANPVVASLQTAQPQFLTVKGNASGLTFDGTVDQLPAHLTFSLQPGLNGANVVDFNSHGDAVGRITANGNGLPAPAGMPKFEAEIEHLPSHLTITLPKDDGNVTFDAHGDHVGRVYAQAFGGSKAAVDPARQLLAFTEGEHVAANLLQIGNAEVSKSAKPFRLKYDVAAVPLDYAVSVPGASLHGTIANPQPATIQFHPLDKDADGEGGVTAEYHVDQGNHTGDGSIDSISLIGTIGAGYLEANLANIPANLEVCLQTDIGKLCRPTWTPTKAGDHTVRQPDFAMQFLPTNLAGTVPSSPLVVNGIACTATTDPAACKNLGQKRKRLVIDDLSFKSAEAAFSSHDEGCTVACGAVWAGASTFGPGSPAEGDHITGRVRYFDGDGDIFPTPEIDLKLPAPGGFVALNKMFFFLHYDVVSLTPLEFASKGSITCGGSPDPELNIGINNFRDVDLLSGTFGVC
jgi:hypothetical protein